MIDRSGCNMKYIPVIQNKLPDKY